MRIKALLAIATLATGIATPAFAQFAKAEDAVKYRQGALFVLGQHFSRIGAMANGRVPYDAKLALENAQVVNDMAKLPWAAFGPATEKLSQKAKPEIWTEQAKFKEQADKFVAESAKLLAAAKTNNLDNLKAAFGPAAATCKSCHDGYRNN
jgi:cytochrome c556